MPIMQTGEEMMPKEVDIPHWARSMVDNFRRELQLPERVTDRMIFARLQETSGMNPDDERVMVGNLVNETLPMAGEEKPANG